jgi:hypothetical protein
MKFEVVLTVLIYCPKCSEYHEAKESGDPYVTWIDDCGNKVAIHSKIERR